LTGTIPSLDFAHLDLSDNALTGTIPSTYASLPLWASLLLHGNNLNGTAPFCNNINASSRSDFSDVLVVADCDKVSCPCCTHCCPTGRDGIPVYDSC
jgi:hypothetical protein